MTSKIETTNELRDDKVLRLVIKYSIPAILAMMVTSLYNTVDRAFIGSMKDVGALAISGLGVTMPFMTILGAFCVGLAVGGSTNIAIKLGEGNKEEAEKALGNTFAIELFVGIAMMIISAFFLEDILYFFGASSDTIKYSMDYMSVIMCGAWFNLPGFAMNSAIRGEGNPKLASKMMITSCLLNLILDPIFIFGFGMGIKGAALGTVICQLVICLWSTYYFTKGKSNLKLRLKNIRIESKIIKGILVIALTQFCMELSAGFIHLITNKVLKLYGGDLAIGAMTIMSSIMQIILLPANGLTQGAQPIISYNYGAKNIDRVKKTFKYTVLATLSYTFFMCLILMIAPEMVVKIFNNDPSLLEITSWSIKIYFAGIFIFGIQAACQSTFLALGQAKISLFLALLRKIILLVPLIFILPIIMEEKLFAVLLAEPVADVTAVLITSICFTVFYKKTLNVMDKNENKFVENEKPSIN